MKAVSQIIGAALLIAIALTTASILMQWTAIFSEKETGEIKSETENELRCQYAELYISNVTYDCNIECNEGTSDYCSGIPSNCFAHHESQENCTIGGCTWLPEECSGTPNACSSYNNQTNCTGFGCTWINDYCDGTPNSCSYYQNEITCSYDAGCTWGNLGASNSTATVLDRITDEGTGLLSQYINHVFYDPNNERWHVVLIAADSDIHTYSTSKNDGLVWADGIDIVAGTYDWDDYSCVLDLDGLTTYLHCVYTDSSWDYLYYRRCNLTGTSPYIACGTQEIPYDASNQGENSTDDVSFPRIAIDSNDCLLISFNFEDDSEATADEMEIVMIKEASSTLCGDGDWDGAADTATGFPIYSIQSDIGYNADVAAGIYSFNDLDAQLVWEDSDSTTAVIWNTIFFNGTSNAFGTERQLDPNIEYMASKTSVIIGSRSVFFAMDDATTDLDAFIINSKDGSLSSQIDTGLNIRYVSGTEQAIAAVVDVNAIGSDDIWVFGVNNADVDDIYYARSTDGGSTWEAPVLWVNDAGTTEIKYMSAYFSSENCDIMVMWQNNSVANWSVMTKVINTGSCGDGSCSGTPDICGTYNDSQTNCERVSCTWKLANCTGVPDICSTYNLSQTNCSISGCNWSLANCTGLPGACGLHNSSESACTIAGCIWVPGDPGSCVEAGYHNITYNISNLGSVAFSIDEFFIRNTTGHLFIYNISETQISPGNNTEIIAEYTNKKLNHTIQEIIIASKNCPKTARDIFPGDFINYVNC